MPQRSGSVSVQTWLRQLWYPAGSPSTKGEAAKSAVATGCSARLARNLRTMWRVSFSSPLSSTVSTFPLSRSMRRMR